MHAQRTFDGAHAPIALAGSSSTPNQFLSRLGAPVLTCTTGERLFGRGVAVSDEMVRRMQGSSLQLRDV